MFAFQFGKKENYLSIQYFILR